MAGIWSLSWWKRQSEDANPGPSELTTILLIYCAAATAIQRDPIGTVTERMVRASVVAL